MVLKGVSIYTFITCQFVSRHDRRGISSLHVHAEDVFSCCCLHTTAHVGLC
jgi:hypothetical protein